MEGNQGKPAVAPNQKPKTKGIAKPNAEIEQTTPEAPGERPGKQPVFKVDKNILKVFNTLFYTPKQSDTPREIPWVEFLHAMTVTGFASQQLYGSIWQFTPTKLDVD